MTVALILERWQWPLNAPGAEACSIPWTSLLVLQTPDSLWEAPGSLDKVFGDVNMPKEIHSCPGVLEAGW